MSYSPYADFTSSPPFFHGGINTKNIYDEGQGVAPPDKHNLTINDLYRTPFLLTSSHNTNFRDMAQTALKGVQANSDLSRMYFSDKNMRRLQHMIKKEIYNRTNGNFRLDVDQDEQKLFIVMRAVYLEHARFLPGIEQEQIMKLNNKVVCEVIPGMITELRQYYGYLKDINQPRDILPNPINVNGAGRNQLPSITTTWS